MRRERRECERGEQEEERRSRVIKSISFNLQVLETSREMSDLGVERERERDKKKIER